MPKPVYLIVCFLVLFHFKTIAQIAPYQRPNEWKGNTGAPMYKNIPVAKLLTERILNKNSSSPGIFHASQINSVNVCNTWTFQVQIQSGKSELPVDVVAIPTSSYIIAGADSTGNEENGRLIKVTADGIVSASKEVLSGTQKIRLQKLRYFSNGNLYALGTLSDPFTLNSSPFILQIDTTDLHIITSFKIQLPSGGLWKACDFNEWVAGTFSVLSYNDSLLNVTKAITGGGVIWSTSFHTKNKPEPVGIGNEFNDAYVAYNETDSGFKKGGLIDVDFATGNFKYGTILGGMADNSEYVFQSIITNNYRPRITALRMNNGKASFIKLNCSSNLAGISREIYSLNSFIADQWLISRQSNWSDVMAAMSAQNNKDIFVAFSFPDNYNTPITGKKITYPYGVELHDIIRTDDGGSLILSKEPASANKIVLTKIDSIGSLPGCNSSGIGASFEEENQVQADNMITSSVSATIFTPFAFAEKDLISNVAEDCKMLYCPSVAAPDSCLRTFLKQYRVNTNSIISDQIFLTNNSNLLVTARTRENPYDATDDPTFVLFDTTGKLIDAKSFSSDTKINIYKTIKSRDGNFISVGVIYYKFDSSDMYIFKFDQQLNIIWQKKIVPSNGFQSIPEFIESAEGDLYCYVIDASFSPEEMRYLMKLNSTGNTVWFKKYDAGTSIFFHSFEFDPKLCELGDFIYLKYNQGNGDFSPNIIKLKKSDGSIVWSRAYKLSSQVLGNYGLNINSFFTDNVNLYLTARAYQSSLFFKINPDGVIIHSLQIPKDFLEISTLGYEKLNKLIGSVNYTSFTGNNYVQNSGVIELDTAFKILQYQYLKMPGYGAIYDLKNFSDSVNYGLGSVLYPNPYWSSINLIKFNFNSTFASCEINAVPLNFINLPVQNIQQLSTATSVLLPTAVTHNDAFGNSSLNYSGYYCGNNPLCNAIKIIAPPGICDTSIVYNYYAQKTPGCQALVNWSLDTLTNQLQVISISDSLLQLKVKQQGSVQIKAKIFSSCKWIEDSVITVVSLSGHAPLNLGPDTIICPGNTVVLNAKNGYASYKWQDGSTDSTFNVTIPGKYYVSTTDACGGFSSDTVVVAAHAPIPFDIGPDLLICKNDTANIIAPAGFIHYQWTSYNISNDTAQNVNIFPSINTWYKVVAEKTPGCFASDSLFVTVKNVPAVNLGNDTSFCASESVTLNAGAGFDMWQWNTGSLNKIITVNQQGIYSVKATLNGCSSYDTLQVLNVYPLPLFSLGSDTGLCKGQQLQFTFNLPQALYKWNTGSNLNSFTINQAGTYWLQVSQQGCIKADTITVIYNPSPALNLGNDTTLCEYQTLLLNAFNSNATYTWQDGTSTPDYRVSKAGEYFVIANLSNCKASDTVNITYKALPFFTLGKDSFLCTGQQYILTPLLNTNASLLWQDGSVATVYKISKEGIYTATASNECGSYTDSVVISSGACNIMMPSAFTPNGDGINDVFKVKYPFPVKQFSMVVYDRWGEKVFETNSIDGAWDGNWKGKPSTQNSYVWIIRFINSNNEPQQLKGVVTLLR